MRHSPVSAGIACFALACGLGMSPWVKAESLYTVITIPGGTCQLSIPTTNTGVRPKATGFRNESATVSNFVYCPIISPIISSGGKVFVQLALAVYSIDGAAHPVTCTAVVGAFDTPSAPLIYSPKSASVDGSDTPSGQIFGWSAADFGGVAGDPISGSFVTSITCSLPPQTAINFLQGSYYYLVGQ